MKENFKRCLDFTLKYEGGYSNHSKDPGGPTNMGITIATLSHELGRRATISDVMGMTKATAENIYHKKFWNTVNGDDLPAGVDLMMFDIAVNSGPGRALNWYKEISNSTSYFQILELDKKRLGFYRHLANFKFFGKGWLAREKACKDLAMKMRSA
jgi:lysozyme family protein